MGPGRGFSRPGSNLRAKKKKPGQRAGLNHDGRLSMGGLTASLIV